MDTKVMTLRRTVILSLSLIVGASACSDSDPTGPTVSAVAGTYQATSFIAAGEDVVAAGGSLTLNMGADGSVGGTLFIPESVGGPLNADMAGTWMLIGDSISISQMADTFVRDSDWRWDDGVLEGSFETTVSVRMDRQ
jgi:hypothetical protein